MGIKIGSQTIGNIFTQTYFEGFEAPSSGSVIGLQSGSYSNGSTWTSTTGSSVIVVNSPLASGSNGRWQFNGTDEYLNITQSTLNATFNTSDSSIAQPFTFLFYGTIGSLSTRRALFGAGGGGYSFGGDAILRTDSSPGAGRIHLDLRTVAGTSNRFNIAGSSGSLLNLAVVQDNNASQSVYQNGVLLATSGALAGGYAPWRSNNGTDGAYIGFNNDIDTDNYNGQLGAAYLYNRPLSATEISQSAQTFYSGSPAGMFITPITSVFLGTSKIFPEIPSSLNVMTLVIGGGGAGGVGTGGGGGAGGVVYSASLSLPVGTYAANVGSGGAASAGPVGLSNSTQSGNFGQTSSFQSGSISVIAVGGGGGAAYEGGAVAYAKSGGSGGGGSNFNNVLYRAGGSGSAGQGNNGGTVTSNPNGSGAGGGGASQAGSGTEVTGRGAPGGSGSAYTIRSGTSVFYGGGGGAGSYNTQNGGLASAGGGQGGNAAGGAGFSGSANTGGGGGGSNRNVNGTVNGAGGAGGSGIIVIAYLTSSAAGLIVSGGIETTYTSASAVYKSHTFLSSSNLVIS